MLNSPVPLRRHALKPSLILGAALVILAFSGTFISAAAAPAAAASPIVVVSGPVPAGAAQPAHTSYTRPRPVPPLVNNWARAWNAGAADELASHFTSTATYQDFAFGASFTGRGEIAEWVRITHGAIGNLHVEVTDAFHAGDRISVRWTFSGQIVGAPKPFSVPASTVMELRRGKISANGDYYNLADVLRQSGLPADTNF